MAAILVANPSGNVTLLEVMDYQCPHCQHMLGVINNLAKNNPSLKVRLIPVAIENKTSLLEASAIYVLAEKSRYFKMTNDYFLKHKLDRRGVVAFLKGLPINQNKLFTQMHQKWILNEIESGLALLKHFKSGTPLILIYQTQGAKQLQIFRGEAKEALLQKAIETIG